MSSTRSTVARRAGVKARRLLSRTGSHIISAVDHRLALTPRSRNYGFDRGTPVDRFYIDDFIARHAGTQQPTVGVVRGRVLEFGDATYAGRYAAPGAQIDIAHVEPDHPGATVRGDLTERDDLPSDDFDCVLCTQVLNAIVNVPDAIATLYRILRPGGVVLATLPGITPISRPDIDHWGDYWRFTTMSARAMFERSFPPPNVHVEAYGNLRAAIALLKGRPAEELSAAELELRDPYYEIVIAVRARKPAG